MIQQLQIYSWSTSKRTLDQSPPPGPTTALRSWFRCSQGVEGAGGAGGERGGERGGAGGVGGSGGSEQGRSGSAGRLGSMVRPYTQEVKGGLSLTSIPAHIAHTHFHIIH